MTTGELLEDSTINLHEQTALDVIQVREDVVLRPMEKSDAKALLKILETDPSIRDRVTVAARLKTPEDVEKEVAAYTSDESVIRYVIVEKGMVVGLTSFWRDEGFFGQAPMPHTFGFGFFLDPRARGQGLVTDCIRSLMEVAQRSFRVDNFIAFCESDNTDSQAVLQKVGMAETDICYTEPTHAWAENMWLKSTTIDNQSLQDKG